MPRTRHSQGRVGTEVIPDDWSATHRPVMNKTFTADIAIRQPGGTQGEFDPDTGTWGTVPYEPHYTGSARIQVLSAFEADHVVPGREINTMAYQVSVPYDAAVEPPGDVTVVGVLVKVTAVYDNGDFSLVGRDLILRTLHRGSLSWERDLYCTDKLGSV